MGITTKGRTALSVMKFLPDAFDGLLPERIARKLSPVSEFYKDKQRPEGHAPEFSDIILALARGYDMHPDAFESWDGIRMGSLVTHISDTFGADRILNILFGLARGIEDIIQVRSFVQVAGAARLAIYNASLDDIPPMSRPDGAKFEAETTPARNTVADLGDVLLALQYPRHADIIPLVSDLTVQQKHAVFQNLRDSGWSAVSGNATRLLYEAGAEGLPLGRILQVWNITDSMEEGRTDFVLDAVRSRLADEYVLALIENKG